MEKERSIDELRFAELIGKGRETGTLSESDKSELKNLANLIGVKTEVESEDKENTKTCYWVCQNNFACNPQSPPPNCICRRICF